MTNLDMLHDALKGLNESDQKSFLAHLAGALSENVTQKVMERAVMEARRYVLDYQLRESLRRLEEVGS